MKSPKPKVPRPLIWASVVGGLIGVIYLLAGLLALAESAVAPIWAFFGLTGFAMLSGGIGLVTGRRWAARWAEFGVGALLALNGFATISLLFTLLFVGRPHAPLGVWFTAPVMVGLTALLAWIFRQFRSDETQHFLWAIEEAKIEVRSHEIADVEEGVFELGEAPESVVLDFEQKPLEAELIESEVRVEEHEPAQ